jgi:hypothetical protein
VQQQVSALGHPLLWLNCFDSQLVIACLFVASHVTTPALSVVPATQVAVHHIYKKAYFVALREALLSWDETELSAVKAALHRSAGAPSYGLPPSASEADRKTKRDAVDANISARMFYDSAYFTARVRRVVLPAPQLYTRVRAVFAYYGRRVDPKKNKALFNSEVHTPVLLLY